MMNENIVFLGHFSTIAKEGGMSRNLAFFKFFSQKQPIIFNTFKVNKWHRLLNNFKILFFLFFCKNKTIFIHQIGVLMLFPIFLFRIRIFCSFFSWFFERLSKENNFFVEVNDLIYEQSIDLDLKTDKTFLIFQEKLYTLKKANYIFASFEMEKYVNQKYRKCTKNTQVIINGGAEILTVKIVNHEVFQTESLKFVYAGSLNKGRQIENLISCFKDIKDKTLILLGNNGDWLKELKLPSNVFFLGDFEENVAANIVRKCDFGIIPYDSTRFYYNLCYPTKVSFYLTCGIPILSTPMTETKNVIDKYNVCIFAHNEDFSKSIERLTLNDVQMYKTRVFTVKQNFTWDYLLSKLNLN